MGRGIRRPSTRQGSGSRRRGCTGGRGGTYAETAREPGVDPGSPSDRVGRADAAQAPAGDSPFQTAEDLRGPRRGNERLKGENEMLLKAGALFAGRQP